MAEKSLFWFTDGFDGAVGDGSAPYTQEEFTFFNKSALGEGVIADTRLTVFEEPLFVSGTSSPLSVTAGEYLLDGFFYRSDAVESMIVPTPAVGTTGGRVILRADYTTATVRMAVKMSADGVAALPTLADTPNVIKEATLAGFTITTGGVIDITVGRVFCRTGLVLPLPDVLEWNGQNRLTIADGGVSTAQIADGAVTAAKAGEGVPVLTERQGGSATNWLTAGATNYTVGNVEQIIGSTNTTITTGSSNVAFTVTLPFSFAQNPFLILSLTSASLTSKPYQVYPSPVTPPLNQLSIVVVIADGTTAPSDIDLRVSWLAIGQPA